jgi:serine/threonine protein kinase
VSDEGRLVAGRYRVQRRIGSGAMGVVWECVDERLHRTVAVKQLLLQPGLDQGEAEEARQRAMREGRIAARLQHQHAISVYDVAEDEGQPVLVMEFLPSTSLAAMMSEHGPLPPREVARVGAQVAGALGAAHAAGVVHRDIKPGNILLGDNGTVKITDFGISRAQGDVQVTKTGMLAGTPAYLSPDVAMGHEPTPASDVFSLGATLYAAIEGRPPFGDNENTLALLHAVAAAQVVPPQQSGPMSEPLMAMMQARPEDRPDMAQVHEMLQQVADGFPVSSVPTAAAPIPPAFDPNQNSNPDLQPTSAIGAGHDRTAVRPPYGDPYGGSGGTSYMSGGQAEGPYYDEERPRRRGRPVLISALALIAVAVLAVLGVSAYMRTSEQPPPATPAGQTNPAPPPVAPATSSHEPTSSKKHRPTRTSQQEETTQQPVQPPPQAPTTTQQPTTTTQPTTSSHQPTTSSQQQTQSSSAAAGSSASGQAASASGSTSSSNAPD